MGRYTRIFLFGSVAIAGLLYLVLRRFFLGLFEPGGAGTLLYGLLVCLFVVGGSFFLLKRAFAAPNRSFLIIFFGGIAGRFLLFTAAVALAYLLPGLSWRGALMAILIAYFPLTGIELYCAVRGGPAGAPKGAVSGATAE